MIHQILADLKLNADWSDVIKELENTAPKIPSFIPANDNTADMKYQSARRDGYLYLINRLITNK